MFYPVAEIQKSKNSEKMKDVNESRYNSSKVSSPVLCATDNAINNENSNEILAEALHEINAASLKNPIEDGKRVCFYVSS